MKSAVWFLYFCGLMFLGVAAYLGVESWPLVILAMLPVGTIGAWGCAHICDTIDARRKYRKLIESTRRSDCGQHIRYGA